MKACVAHDLRLFSAQRPTFESYARRARPSSVKRAARGGAHEILHNEKWIRYDSCDTQLRATTSRVASVTTVFVFVLGVGGGCGDGRG